jgi:hypothetical protein
MKIMMISLWAIFLSLNMGCSAQKANQGSTAKVWVTKLDGSKQCGMEANDPLSPEAAQEQLEKAGIKVFEAKAGRDGQMRTMVCGSPTGKTVECLIMASDEAKAAKLGFKPRMVGEALPPPPAKEEKSY